MTKEEALNTLMKMRAWREWGKEQKEEERPEMPEQKEVDEAFDVCIKLLQPSLPSNLDEAAQKVEDYYDVYEVRGYLCCNRGDIKDAFKAGAEWLAGQGVTFESVVEEWSNPSGHRELSGLEEILKDFNWQDKVVVQIRKK